MSKFFKVSFTHTETVTTEGTAEGESIEDVAEKLQNYFGVNYENFKINEITELQETPSISTGKPELRVVN